MVLSKKTNWLLDWLSHWHRQDLDVGGNDHSQHEAALKHDKRKRSATEYDFAIYNNGKNAYLLSSPMDITINPGMASPPSSPSRSSIISSTKSSILDIVHRRKSSASSITSLQQSPFTRSLSLTGRRPAHSVIVTHFPPLYCTPTSLSTTMIDSSTRPHSTCNPIMNGNSNHRSPPPPPSLSPSGLPLSSCGKTDNTLSSVGLSDVTALSQQHTSLSTHQQHHHPTETTNNNSHHLSSRVQTIIPLPHTVAGPEEHRRLSLESTSVNKSPTNRPRLYEALLKHGTPFSEHTVHMDDNLPPTTENYNKRMTLNHELMKLALGGFFKSPLDPEQDKELQILQIGCGDGSWCIDCAKEFPQWFVLGLDNKEGGDLISTSLARKAMLSNISSAAAVAIKQQHQQQQQPIPPSSSSLSSSSSTSSSSFSSSAGGHGNNFLFMKSSLSLVESLKRLPDGCFDLVYARFLTLALSLNDYEALVNECWRVCKPGGFVELTELDMRIYEYTGAGKLIQWTNQQVTSSMQHRNLDSRLPRNLQDQFFKLLVDDQSDISRRRQDSYHVNYISLPLGVWGGRLGVIFRDDVHDILDTMLAGDKSGNKPMNEDWQATMNMLDDELDAQKAFMNLYQVFAQRSKS